MPEPAAMNVEKERVHELEASRPAKRRRRGLICCGVCVAVIIFIVLLIVILAFTVFKAKRPTTTIQSVSLQDLDVSIDALRLRVNLNVSLDVDLTIKNPNKVGFKYTNSNALLNYRGKLVGEVPIPAGKISAGETKAMNLTLTILADRLISDSQLYGDIIAGELPLNTYTKISGKVSIIGIKVHVVSETWCDLTVNISNSTIGNQQCKYKTEL